MDASGHPAALTESARLAALADLAILDTDSEREFDAITKVDTRNNPSRFGQ
ncbi:hypothetical protein [Croceicoccus hydrothermalis]|uniref:hypothetical protein n=1 Tax=Croceicoccus hydrothermalis TaxID=2867964 RepID=UPI001EFA82C4|nr:hypothetical protein [Croceicoccus hydrothermalis]